MYALRRIESFATRHPIAGPVAWLLCVQYFIVQVVVAAAWKQSPYSWRLNAISDLGATSCGSFDDRLVCSPSHGLMNASFMLLGLSMTIGSVLLYQVLRKSRIGFSCMAAAGIGAIMVGLFPENILHWAHGAGADLAFLIGNIALIVFGITLGFSRWFKWYSIASGVVALIALYLFVSHQHFFLGLGGMERIVAYPQTIWLIVTGLYLLRNRRYLARSVQSSAH